MLIASVYRFIVAVLIRKLLPVLLLPTLAAAECPTLRMGAEGHQKAAQLADKTLRYLRESDAKVALLGRAGSDAPTKRFAAKVGVWNYTHGGLVYRNHPDGEWTVVHLINTCAEDAAVFADSVLQFFLDNPHEYRTVIAIPEKPLQDALEELIIEKDAATNYLSKTTYSSISYPFSTERQNSNEYVLDKMAAALALQEGQTILQRKTAKEYFLSSEHRAAFTPEIVKTGFWESLGMDAGLGPDNATFSDHPESARDAREFEIVSVGSLIQFMRNLSMLQSVQEFALEDVAKATDTVWEE